MAMVAVLLLAMTGLINSTHYLILAGQEPVR